MKLVNIIFIFSILLSLVNGELRLNLSSGHLDGSWIVWNQNKSIQIPATVPGGIYTDLQAAGILGENLFYRFHDVEYRWVAKDNWTYQTHFDVPQSMLNKKAINLVFHGIDTIGDIYLNKKLLASVNNMFVRYVLPVKKIIQEKNNTLEVYLKSPIYEANRLAAIQYKNYTVPPECTPSYYNGECHVNFLRKMQASFSWDWGPAFPSAGIWKSVEVEAFDLGVVRDVTALGYRVNETFWQTNISIHVDYAEENYQDHSIDVKLQVDEGNVETKIEKSSRDLPLGGGTSYVYNTTLFVDKDVIREWWPNGYGNQPLYKINVTLLSEDRLETSTKIVRIGYRTVELVQEELRPGMTGLSFYFKVNGVPIFAKGSNWIPAHILPELGYKESTVRYLLESAKDANMNMLRVWGGGVYESDTFYRIADELGILIWQDMMFACSMYPTDEKFLESVRTEIEQQVRRLHHHPSIAIWAGNNENEAALIGNWYGTSNNFDLYKKDYVKLYVDTIKSVVLQNDNYRPYVTSSPSNGKKTEEEGFISNNPYSPLFGDIHYYNYIFDGWNDFTYPDTRFASEYGFQSMPSYKSMSEVSLPGDRKLESKFSIMRQHLLGGNEFMLVGIQRKLPLPEDVESPEYYKTFIYYSQISQAMSTKTETEKYRRDRSKLTENNKGNTMGAMYWQLNDVWPAPSWSSIEFGGRWKMLHYFAKKFFSPVLVSAEVTPTALLKVFLTSDLLEDVKGVQLNISVYSWDNFKPLKVYSSRVLLKKAASEGHATYDLPELLKDANCDKYKCFVYLSAEGPNIFTDNVVYPSAIYEIVNFLKPNITMKVSKTNNPSEALIHINTNRIAPFVWLETYEDGEFSDNGFLLLKSEKDVIFKNRERKPVDIDKVKSTLTIRSIL